MTRREFSPLRSVPFFFAHLVRLIPQLEHRNQCCTDVESCYYINLSLE